MNRLSLARRTQIINCLVEGNSIRSTERMTDTHRDTVMRLMVEVGTGCAKLMDEQMRGLTCERIQVDEIWAYVQKKQRQVTKADDKSRVGDQWTFVAMDPATKLVPTWRIGKRDLPTATAFLTDLSERLTNRVQLSSDALKAYVDATEQAFGADVDYGQAVNFTMQRLPVLAATARPRSPIRSATPSSATRTIPTYRPAWLSVRTSPCG